MIMNAVRRGMRYTVIFDPSKRVREVDRQQAGVTPVLMDVLFQGSRNYFFSRTAKVITFLVMPMRKPGGGTR